MIFSTEIIFEMSSSKWWPFCPKLNEWAHVLNIFQSDVTPLEGKADILVNFFQLSTNTELFAARWDCSDFFACDLEL